MVVFFFCKLWFKPDFLSHFKKKNCFWFVFNVIKIVGDIKRCGRPKFWTFWHKIGLDCWRINTMPFKYLWCYAVFAFIMGCCTCWRLSIIDYYCDLIYCVRYNNIISVGSVVSYKINFNFCFCCVLPLFFLSNPLKI